MVCVCVLGVCACTHLCVQECSCVWVCVRVFPCVFPRVCSSVYTCECVYCVCTHMCVQGSDSPGGVWGWGVRSVRCSGGGQLECDKAEERVG